MTVSEEFTSRTGRFRGELLAHCYRMLGSAEEAEDLVQETYLRAWRSFDGFEGRSSVRTWLYRIATNVCLTAIERRRRRPLPSGLGGPAEDPEAPLVAGPEVPWLQPFPDALLAAEHEDPAAVAVSRAGTRLALVAALQYLSARQRAVLILRDVLEWPAAEVADLLGTTTTAVNSGLRRARAQLAQALPAEEELAEPTEADRRAVLERFAAAIENADATALAELLREDVTLEMPPLLTWFAGRQAVVRVAASHLLSGPGRLRLVPVMANGQAAFAVYQREPGGAYHAHAVLVPTVTRTGIARMVAFQNPGLLASFGLPREDGPTAAGPAGRLVAVGDRELTRHPAQAGRRRFPRLRLVCISRPPTERPGTRSQRRQAAMADHKVVNREEWQAARDELLVREKEHTRMADELARQRRELPWVAIQKPYRFDTDDGTRTLAELFDGRSQLLLYHFMFGPSYLAGDPVNSSIADGLDGLLPHLHARDLTLLLVSRAPLAKLQAYKRRMGWSLPWVSAANTDFNFDFGASSTEEQMRGLTPPGEGALPPIVAQNAAAAGTDVLGYLSEAPVVSVFTLQDGAVYQTYATTWRGVEFLMGYYPILDRAPKGRDEDDGFQTWIRRHDEYVQGRAVR